MENRMEIYNSLTKKVEPFVPNEDGKVKNVHLWSDGVPFCTYWKSEKLYYGGLAGKDAAVSGL